jgi:hemerythrin superfamily protein
MGINFNESGATKDKTITTDELFLVIKALKLKRFADIELADDIKNDKTLINSVETKLIKLFEEIHDHASKQNDRSIHIVVAEPVEYEYDDFI